VNISDFVHHPARKFGPLLHTPNKKGTPRAGRRDVPGDGLLFPPQYSWGGGENSYRGKTAYIMLTMLLQIPKLHSNRFAAFYLCVCLVRSGHEDRFSVFLSQLFFHSPNPPFLLIPSCRQRHKNNPQRNTVPRNTTIKTEASNLARYHET
jgi:hypothetical protein